MQLRSNMTGGRQSCAVLGGGGFLGTNLCRRLLASNLTVRALGRRRLFPQQLEGVDWVDGDFADRAALAASTRGCGIVFHLVNDLSGDLVRHLAPTIALLESCRESGQRVVFVSSGGAIYGRTEQLPTPETAPLEPITSYGICNLVIEKYLALYGHLHGLDFRILRVTNAFGPFQVAHRDQGLIAALISSALREEPVDIWGDGSIIRDFIFVDDVVDALLAAARDHSDARIFNIGSGRGRTVREVIAATGRMLDKKIRIQWKPARPSDVPVSVVSVERAKELLGWSPRTPFEEGLRRTASWWKSRIC
jgi:UDP-glucose 4-epimerase